MTKPFLYKKVSTSEFEEFQKVMFSAAGRIVDEEFLQDRIESFFPDRSIAAFKGNRMVGTIGTRPLRMTVPGGTVLPVAAIGQGGVLTSFTRQGIMKELMLQSLRMALDEEETMAVWTTSEWPLYGRFGGGVSSFCAEYEINKNRVKLDGEIPIQGTTDLSSLQDVEPLFQEIHTKCSLLVPGGVSRTNDYWKVIFKKLSSGASLDVLDTANSLPPAQACIYKNNNGDVEGCLIFRVFNRWENGISCGKIQVLYLLHLTTDAYLGVWKFLLGFDLIETIQLVHRPTKEPIRWRLNDGRRLLTNAIYDHIWVRVLNLEKCLLRRKFPPITEPIYIRVLDPLDFVNSSTYSILSDGILNEVQQSSKQPDVSMDIATFSSIYMGGVSCWELFLANKIEGTPDKILKIEFLFRCFNEPFTDTSF